MVASSNPALNRDSFLPFRFWRRFTTFSSKQIFLLPEAGFQFTNLKQNQENAEKARAKFLGKIQSEDSPG